MYFNEVNFLSLNFGGTDDIVSPMEGPNSSPFLVVNILGFEYIYFYGYEAWSLTWQNSKNSKYKGEFTKVYRMRIAGNRDKYITTN